VDRFKDKAVVVTGAGLGIGFATCRAFALEGAFVALNDLEGALAEEGADKINEEIGAERVLPYALDVADVDRVLGMVDDFAGRHGRLDVVIANAGLTNYGAFLEYTPEAFDRLTAVNLRGSYFTAQAAAKAMIRTKSENGRIMLTSSVTGVQAFLNLSAYGVTKAGLRMMARALALELGSYGITVNSICPGAITTERTVADDPNFESNWAGVSPTGRVGFVEDVAETAMFLASPEARQITGQTIIVDGGWTLQSPLPEEHPEQPEFSSQLR
jgi:NAD(P)-dependent dehydrogenase (short-subunit alcohol dehydrogenase family)